MAFLGFFIWFVCGFDIKRIGAFDCKRFTAVEAQCWFYSSCEMDIGHL